MAASADFVSILFPDADNEKYRVLSEVTMHDLGFDQIVKEISRKEAEQNLILKILSKVSADPEVSNFRADVFEDILMYPDLRKRMTELLEKVNFLKDFGSFKKDYEISAGAFDLMHRLEEISEYIECVEAIHACLSDIPVKSRGLVSLREYVDGIFNENGFESLKKDIKDLKADTYNLKSVTLGINLNDRYECESVGLISVNNKKFSKSPIIGNFSDAILKKDNIHDGNAWDGSMRFQPINQTDVDSTVGMETAALAVMNPMIAASTMAHVAMGDSTEDMTRYLDRLMNHMISNTVKRLKEVLSKYVTITIGKITSLIPEFMYYIRWAEYIETLRTRGFVFNKAQAVSEPSVYMKAEGIYNLKLTGAVKSMDEVVTNDLTFDSDRLLYILTGANRGGKTTITQAVGQLFVLAQGGIFIPGNSFVFSPTDAIFTHFPADEDKTLDLGRLGEECKRFRDAYMEATGKSLLLLNETFSTTSFEEGYFIAKDSARAILKKGVRTIYNTHMHKLGFDIDELNSGDSDYKARSIIVKTEEGGKRSFHVTEAPPEGSSFANDIAKKYGVTYESLTEK